MKKIIFLLLIASCSEVLHAQEFSFERKVEMIDSAYDARIDLFVRRCFPEYTIRIKFMKDSFSLCSVESVVNVAPDISEEQLPVLEHFMTEMAIYYNSNNLHIRFDYGFVPGSIDTNFDRMFNRKVIYVTSLDKTTTHSRVIELLAIFNRVTDAYLLHATGGVDPGMNCTNK